MCDDVNAAVDELKAKGVTCGCAKSTICPPSLLL
jgi:hypothetical protein